MIRFPVLQSLPIPRPYNTHTTHTGTHRHTPHTPKKETQKLKFRSERQGTSNALDISPLSISPALDNHIFLITRFHPLNIIIIIMIITA